MSPRRERFDPALPLRRMAEAGTVADALARQIGLRWEAFRERPDPALLDPLERALRALLAEIAAVRTLRDLGGAAAPEGGPRAGDLEEELRRTLSIAEELRAAEAGARPAEASAPPAGEPTGGREPRERDPPPRPQGAGDRGETLPTDGPPHPPPQAAVEGEAPDARAAAARRAPAGGNGPGRPDRVQALDGLLYRLLSDWQHYRRDPSAERAGLLRGELRHALEQLGHLWERGGEARSAEPGTDGADGPAILFPPFRDQSTGLHSREGFDHAARGELKRCRRHERNFALLLVQPTAREIAQLREAAAAVRRALRESDLVGRHVDRALAVALPETSLGDAREVARRLLMALHSTDAWDEAEGRLGIAAYPLDGDTLLTLLEAARRQLQRPAGEVLGPSGRAAG